MALLLIAAACADGGGGEAIGVDTLAGLAAADGEQPAPDSRDGHADDPAHHGADGGDAADMSRINLAQGEIPSLEMIDVSSGATVDIRSLVDNAKPLMFWFWAPH